MYGVALDRNGNYLLLGGSGDEYDNYSATNSTSSVTSSDAWVSYLVVVDKMVIIYFIYSSSSLLKHLHVGGTIITILYVLVLQKLY